MKFKTMYLSDEFSSVARKSVGHKYRPGFTGPWWAEVRVWELIAERGAATVSHARWPCPRPGSEMPITLLSPGSKRGLLGSARNHLTRLQHSDSQREGAQVPGGASSSAVGM